VRDPDGHRTEMLLPGIQIIDIDDEPVRCTVSPKANTNSGCRRRTWWRRPPPSPASRSGVLHRGPADDGGQYLAARMPAVAG
jgi:hypothetical protein